MLRQVLIVAAASLVQVAASAAPDPATATAQSQAATPAMAEAESNRPRMKIRPTVKAQPTPDYPPSEKAAGNGGFAWIKGILGVDGRLTEVVVEKSNAGPALTASALASARATEFAPAKDSAGQPIAVPIVMPFAFAVQGVRPDTITRVEPPFTDAERDLGMSGSVKIGGMVRSDGRIAGAKALVSSRSVELDQAALAAAQASIFRPYKDGSGNPVEEPVNIAYEFVNYRSPGEGGGILRYRCGQFAKDQTWWRANWPETERGDFYNLVLGVGTMRRISAFAANPSSIKAYVEDFELRWVRAIAACRQRPDELFIDIFKPEGDDARRLAQSKH